MNSFLKGRQAFFKQNVQHILEKIFLSLEYSTLKQCHSVCKEWYHYLNSDFFQRVARSVFSFHKWSDATQTELRLIECNPKRMTTNGEEVVHTNDRGGLEKVCYTTKEGVTRYVPVNDLRLDARDVQFIILDSIILIITPLTHYNVTTFQVYSLHKQSVEVCELFKKSFNFKEHYYDHAIGYRTVLGVKNNNSIKLFLVHISKNHEGGDCWATNRQADTGIQEFRTNSCYVEKFHEYEVGDNGWNLERHDCKFTPSYAFSNRCSNFCCPPPSSICQMILLLCIIAPVDNG